MDAPQGPQPPHPVLKALLLCNQAIREVGTNKVTLVGIFDRVTAPRFPAEFSGGLAVYARLTDAEGLYQMRLELVRLEDEQATGRAEGETNIQSRTGSHELTFNIGLVAFERPGGYEFRLFANGRYLGGMVLHVLQSEQQEAPHGDES